MLHHRALQLLADLVHANKHVRHRAIQVRHQTAGAFLVPCPLSVSCQQNQDHIDRGGGSFDNVLELVQVDVTKSCAALCCAVQVGVLLPLVRLLMVGDSRTQGAAALLVGQFAAPPLEEGALTVGLGEPYSYRIGHCADTEQCHGSCVCCEVRDHAEQQPPSWWHLSWRLLGQLQHVSGMPIVQKLQPNRCESLTHQRDTAC